MVGIMTSYTLASPISDSFHDSSMPTVLLLGGWTPGPINFIRTKLQSEFSCHIMSPILIMPPFFRPFWCDLNFCLMFIVCIGFLFALSKVWIQFESFERFLYLSMVVAAFVYWIRLMVAVVARSSIADGVEKCIQAMRQRNVVLCVGFSWGAGVLSELLTRDVGLDTQPAYILMAPVSAVTAMAAMREDAAFRLQPLDGHGMVHVVHASDDPMFCPHPEHWNMIPGIKSYTLQDIHIFKNASSRRSLAEIVTALFRLKTEGEGPQL